MNNTTEYKVWDLPIRLFHWVNVICVLCLLFLGLIMLNKAQLGIQSIEAKIALKQLHVIIGYVFAVNLCIRLIWGFTGNQYSRWSHILPNKLFINDLRQYMGRAHLKQPQTYLGHNPLGRLAVMAMFILFITLMTTGLIRAGTDIYYPPFGHLAQQHVAAPNIAPATIKPYDKTGTQADKMAELKAFKKPLGTLHIYSAYALMILILLHLIFVVRAEILEGGNIIGAMFSGRKKISHPPEDLPPSSPSD